MAVGFAARQCLGLRRKIEKPLPADEQVGHDAGRAAVETCVRRLLAISGVSRAHLDAHLIKPRRQPLNVTGHRLRIEATGRIPLASAQPLRADVPRRYFDHRSGTRSFYRCTTNLQARFANAPYWLLRCRFATVAANAFLPVGV